MRCVYLKLPTLELSKHRASGRLMMQAILFMALNAVLNTVGVSITRPQNNDEWSIQDGRSLIRFRDGAVRHSLHNVQIPCSLIAAELHKKH